MNDAARSFVSVKFTPVGRTLHVSAARPARGLPAGLAARHGGAAGAGRCRRRPDGGRAGASARSPAPCRRSPAASHRADAAAQVVRKATRDDVVTRLKHQQREQDAQRVCLMKIRERGLAMKLARVEQVFDGSRLIFYYTAEGRVDFRELVRDLAAHFRTRIEMRQIGVRDEARMLGGYGSCGRPLCCTTWLQSFEPISIKMAKQQNLSLNPVEAVGDVRPAEVLPALRAAERQGREARRLRRRRRLRQLQQPDRPRRRLRRLRQRRVRELSSVSPSTVARTGSLASASPSAIPPASAPRSRSRPRRIRASSRSASRLSTVRLGRDADRFEPGRLSAAAGRAAYDADRRGRGGRARRGRSTRSPPRRSTRKRSPPPGCRGAATPSCWRT